MLATSPSPRVTPSSSPALNSTTYLRRSRPHAGRTNSASPIVKPRSAHVCSPSSTTTSVANNNNFASTQTATHPSSNSSQCSLPHQRSSFQPQPSQTSPRFSTTTSRGTQTWPTRPEPLTTSRREEKVQMVDAQTQYSPPVSSTTKSRTPATSIANLQLHESTSASSLTSSTSTSSLPRRKPFDPVADAAMSAALMGTSNAISTAAQSSKVPRDSSAQSPTQLQRVPSSATKRNHSTSDESLQPSTVLQDEQKSKSVSNNSTATISSPSNPSSSKKMRPEGAPVRRLPLDYSLCPPRDLVLLISSMLLDLIRFNDAIPLRDGHLTRFHSRAPPGISVLDYLQRLTTHATLLPPILLSMVYYIDKLCALYPAFTISSLTVHRFLITAATVASKGLSDSFWTNKTYARVGGVSVRELALLEMELLTRVQWRIVPQPEVLVDYYKSLVARTEGYELEEETPPADEARSDTGTGQAGQSEPSPVATRESG